MATSSAPALYCVLFPLILSTPFHSKSMKSIEEEEKKPPAKRSRNAPAEDTASNQNEIYQTTANITILDEAMQSSISRYMDIYDWGNVQKTSKLFSSWPKPPPPKIDYHLISFCITDRRNFAYCGVAKTLNAVKDAFKYIYTREEAHPGTEKVRTHPTMEEYQE